MNVTRTLATSFLAVGIAVVAHSPSDAQVGALNLSWHNAISPCTYVQNQDFAGAANYKMVVYVEGETRSHKGNRVALAGAPDIRNAWRFDPLPDGCQGGQLTLNTAGLSKTCTAFGLGAHATIFDFAYDNVTGKVILDMLDAYAASVGSGGPQTMYQIDFNHAFSVVGPADPNLACGEAEVAACFHLLPDSEILFLDNSKGTFNVNHDFVTWQDPLNEGGCPGATQNENSTWGRVKGLYR